MTAVMTTGEYLQEARRLDEATPPGLRPVRLGIASTFTAEFLRPYLLVEGARRGLLVRPYFGPFGQLEQELLDPASALLASTPDAVVIAVRIEDLAPAMSDQAMRMDRAAIATVVQDVLSRLESLVTGFRRHSGAPLFVFNFVEARRLSLGLASTLHDPSPSDVIGQLNAALAALARHVPGVFVVDAARVALEVGLDRWVDARLEFMARMPYSADAARALAHRLARSVRAALVPACKCLVLDLDNTLWGGVLGEDLIGGIKLGREYPGNVFREFHRQILALRDRGVLLAIASKNDEADARDALERHPDALLRPDHFAAMQIHWHDKAISLRAIARDLNIGTDALVFFDDNPVEREWVRSQLPEVCVVDVPESPLGYADALDASGAFDQLQVVGEDARRAVMYSEETKRELLRQRTPDVAEFLRELGTEVTVGLVGPDDLPRVVQLLGKTNQFNLTTRRHGAGEVQGLIDSGAIALWLRASDRYGDHGLVGAAITVPEDGERWRIDVLLMSCRILGRGIEQAFFASLVGAVQRRHGRQLIGEYRPTAKNHIVAGFYRDAGFAELGGGFWRLELDGLEPAPPPHVALNAAGR